MSYILLLTNSAYPDNLNSIEIELPDDAGISQQEYVERHIIDSIYRANSKLLISKVEYANITEQYPFFIDSNYAGLIVEEIEISPSSAGYYRSRHFSIIESQGKFFIRKPCVIVYTSMPVEGSRTAIVSQSIFPSLIEYMEENCSSPSFTMTKYPIMYLNLINKSMTASSIIRKMAGLNIMGITTIDVFANTLDYKTVERNLVSFLRKYTDYNGIDSTYSTSTYSFDFEKKLFSIKTDDLIVGKYLDSKNNGTVLDFHGSSEKFYWMDILPMFALAYSNNYKIDLSMLEKFYYDNNEKFTSFNKKYKRFLFLINYFKKVIGGIENV